MNKNFVKFGLSAMMTLAMASSAFASNNSGTYLYATAAQTGAYPSHAQACITGIETSEGDAEGTTDIFVSVATIEEQGVSGEITKIVIGSIEASAKNGVVTLEGVSNDDINEFGLVYASVYLSNAGHGAVSCYMDVIE